MKKHLIILSILVILIIIGFYISKGQSSQKTSEYNPDGVEIIVGDNKDGTQLPESSDNQSSNLNQQLGPATINDIMGGNASDLGQTPSIDKLLEGKEIEINK